MPRPPGKRAHAGKKTPHSPLAAACAALGLDPERLELTAALAALRRAIDTRQLLHGEVLCRAVLLARPEQPDAWALRGEIALKDNDPASARVYFHEALRCLDELPAVQDLRRQRHQYWLAIAECNKALNRRELAEKALLEAARFDPDAQVAAASASDVGALLERAYRAILQNQLNVAEPLLKTVLQLAPANAMAWQGLAVLEHKRGHHDAALTAIDRAIELEPDEAGFYNNRGVFLKPLGAPRLAERIAAYEAALARRPDFKEALSNLADALTSARRFDEAQSALDRALAIDPRYLNARINQVNLLKAHDKKREALAAIDAVLEESRHVEALNLKGALLLELGEPHAALALLEEARTLDSRNPSVLNNLGNAYLATKRPTKAIEAYRSAVILAPGMAEAQANLALALLTQIEQGAPRGEYLALAKEHLAKAQALDPNLPQLFIAEGILKKDHQNDREGAIAAYEKALALKPQSPQALQGLAAIAADMGERAKAREYLRRALELDPDDRDLISNYIFALNYDPAATPQEIFEAACQFGQRIQAHAGAPYTHWPNARDPHKRLKVGFVSGDFRRHPVAYFTVGLFQHLPRHEVEVYAYHNHPGTDDMTARIQQAVDHWRTLYDLSTEAACELIRADGIDILIDLSGHTGYNRLDVFAKKPAPVSISWLGFATSTGLPSVDFLLADAVTVPDEDRSLYTEQVLHAPVVGSLTLESDLEAQIAPLPCLHRGHVTFVSANNLIKINEQVVQTWAEILHRVEKSRLVVKYRQLGDDYVRKRLLQAFVDHGIDPERLSFHSSIPRRRDALEFLSVEGDIALDTFPFTGATTTLETLFMGVPVVTLLGDRFSGRMSASYVLHLGLASCVAKSAADYVEKAVTLAHNPELLAQWRGELRERLLRSLAGNPQRFAADWVALIRRAWQQGISV